MTVGFRARNQVVLGAAVRTLCLAGVGNVQKNTGVQIPAGRIACWAMQRQISAVHHDGCLRCSVCLTHDGSFRALCYLTGVSQSL
jgi:hypothetical protein